MRRRDWLARAGEIALLLGVVLWMLGREACNNPLNQGVTTDGSIFMAIGRGMAQGLTPYVDMTENKGPLLFLMMGLPQLVWEGGGGVYALEILFAVTGCWALLMCARWLAGRGYSLLCVLPPVMVYIAQLGANFAEEYNLFFLIVSMAVLVHTFTGRQRGGGLRAPALGACAAAVALIKASDLPGVGVAVLFYAWHTVREKRGFWKEALRFCLGVALVAVPVLLYLWRVGALDAMIREYILNNVSHVATAKDYDFWEMRLYIIRGGYGLASLTPVLWMAAALLVRALLARLKGGAARVRWEAPLLAYGAALAVANLFTGYIAGTGFYQHLMMGEGTKMLALLLALSAALRLFNARPAWLRRAQDILALLLLAPIVVQSLQNLAPERMEARARQALLRAQEERVILEEITGYEDSVYTIGVPTDWYWRCGLQPAFPYYNIVGFIVDNVGEGLEYRFERYLIDEGIDMLVVKGDVEEYRGVLTNETVDYIHENYEVVVEDGEGKRLMRLI